MGEAYFLPAQCLVFYKRNDEAMVLVQSVDIKSDGKVAGCRNSILTSHFKMQWSQSVDRQDHHHVTGIR